MQTRTQIRELLEARGLAPRKSLGQNFLVDHNMLKKLVAAAELSPGDVVLEVGPGTGTLTEELLACGAHVIACELDAGLAHLLRERLGGHPSFTLFEGDCLAKGKPNPDLLAIVDAARLRAGRPTFSLVANLPYDAATPLMMGLLISVPACTAQHVTIQREVADRLRAAPNTDAFGTLSIIVGATAQVSLIATLPPGCFWPEPKVTSAMVSLRRLKTPQTADASALAEFCQRLFSQRRRQLRAILGDLPHWPEGISPTARAETLTPAQLEALRLALPPSV